MLVPRRVEVENPANFECTQIFGDGRFMDFMANNLKTVLPDLTSLGKFDLIYWLVNV